LTALVSREREDNCLPSNHKQEPLHLAGDAPSVENGLYGRNLQQRKRFFDCISERKKWGKSNTQGRRSLSPICVVEKAVASRKEFFRAYLGSGGMKTVSPYSVVGKRLSATGAASQLTAAMAKNFGFHACSKNLYMRHNGGCYLQASFPAALLH
jgi:hypothetical protein